MKTHRLRASFALYASLILFLAMSSGAFFNSAQAQVQNGDQMTGKIQFKHTPVQLKDLPHPGDPFTLRVSIRKMSATTQILRVVLVRDGKFLIVSSDEAYRNDRDQPTYDFHFSLKESIEAPSNLRFRTSRFLLHLCHSQTRTVSQLFLV